MIENEIVAEQAEENEESTEEVFCLIALVTKVVILRVSQTMVWKTPANYSIQNMNHTWNRNRKLLNLNLKLIAIFAISSSGVMNF